MQLLPLVPCDDDVFVCATHSLSSVHMSSQHNNTDGRQLGADSPNIMKQLPQMEHEENQKTQSEAPMLATANSTPANSGTQIPPPHPKAGAGKKHVNECLLQKNHIPVIKPMAAFDTVIISK